MVNVGIIGLGGMGRVHFRCHQASRSGHLVALCDIDERKLKGDWSSIELNIDSSKTPHVDLSGLKTYQNYHDLIADPNVDVVDICTPTNLHAEVTIAALNAGKDVICEKPMVRYASEIDMVLDARRRSGKRLLVGHCLRYWGQYVKAAEIIQSGEYGRPINAWLTRVGGTPLTSWNDWFRKPDASGGVILDLHIHDVDAALWWFGEPDIIEASGQISNGLSMLVNATWSYSDGLLVQLHSGWDDNQPGFRYGFGVQLEHATIVHDSALDDLDPHHKPLTMYRAGKKPVNLDFDTADWTQKEIDDLLDSVANGIPFTTVTPEASGLAAKTALEEQRLIEERL